MKINLIILFFLFFTIKSFAQNYIPMKLDTSCYWVNSFITNDHAKWIPQECNREIITFVEKDTFINNKMYFKLNNYISEINYSTELSNSNNSNYCNDVLRLGAIDFIREDTVLKTMFAYSLSTQTEKQLLKFDYQLGDTVDIGYLYFNPNVDSIKYINYNGVIRKTIYAPLYNSYEIIEGIGASRNFPPSSYHYLYLPDYTLKCYSKGGQTLYGDISQPCLKKPAIAVSTKDVLKNNFTINYSNNSFYIDNPNNEKLKITLLDLMGKILISATTNSAYSQSKISNAISSGIYILHVGNEKGSVVRKILIE